MRCKRNMLFCVYVWIQKKDKNQSNKLLDYCFNDNVIYCTDLAWFFPSNQCIFWLNPSHFTDIPIFIASIFLFFSHLIRHFYNTMHTDLRKNYKKMQLERTWNKQKKNSRFMPVHMYLLKLFFWAVEIIYGYYIWVNLRCREQCGYLVVFCTIPGVHVCPSFKNEHWANDNWDRVSHSFLFLQIIKILSKYLTLLSTPTIWSQEEGERN